MSLPDVEPVFKQAPPEIRLERRDEWDKVNRKIEIAVQIGCEVLADTAMVTNKPWEESDVAASDSYLLKIAPLISPEVYPGPGLSGHLRHARIYHQKLTEKIIEGSRVRNIPIPELSPDEEAFIGDFHDLGRILDPEYYTNDRVSTILLSNLGARPEFMAKFYPMDTILGRSPAVTSMEDLTLAQRIADVADNMAKSKNGIPFTSEGMAEYCKSTASKRYQAKEYGRPSERWGLNAMTSGRANLAAQITLDTMDWMAQEFGIDFEQLGQEVYAELMLPEHQEWISKFEDGRETLDPRYDRLLHRPPIKTVVFDAGGTLLEHADPRLIQELCSHFNCDQEKVLEIFGKLNPPSMAGEISERVYYELFYKEFGQTPPDLLEEARKPFHLPDSFQPMEGMQEVVDLLSRNHELKLFILSDAIEAITPSFSPRLRELFPQIKPENILISNQIRASKKQPGAKAFAKLLEKVGAVDPQSILFIDDNEAYPWVARSQYKIRGFHFRGTNNLSATSRLRNELELAKLI